MAGIKQQSYAHRDAAAQLAHKVIFETGADNLPVVVEIPGPIKPTTVFTRTIGAGEPARSYALPSSLVAPKFAPAESADPVPGFKVQAVFPGDAVELASQPRASSSTPVPHRNSLSPFRCRANAFGKSVRPARRDESLRSGGDARQHAAPGRNIEFIDNAVNGVEHAGSGLHVIGHRVNADHRIACAENRKPFRRFARRYRRPSSRVMFGCKRQLKVPGIPMVVFWITGIFCRRRSVSVGEQISATAATTGGRGLCG